MTAILRETSGFHHAVDASQVRKLGWDEVVQDLYTFDNFFHPFVSELISQLNQTSVAGLLDPTFLQTLHTPFSEKDYKLLNSERVQSTLAEKTIDVTPGGPYANYNWELLYHIPIAVAVHLSKTQRFAEAQKWFHYVFDPTTTDTTDIEIHPTKRYWRFLGFRQDTPVQNINVLLTLLSTPDSELPSDQIPINPDDQKQVKQWVLVSYEQIQQNPFKPHLVASARPLAYQYYVVMKYLDNLIAWGDSLFLQDTIETINEATLCYVLAANLLGPRPRACRRGERWLGKTSSN